MTIHVFFLFPETSGKSLEEIEEMFLEGAPAWKTHVSKHPSPVHFSKTDPEYASEKPHTLHNDSSV